MYALFEMVGCAAEIYQARVKETSCVGFAFDETAAKEWRGKDPKYRTYVYCPSRIYSNNNITAVDVFRPVIDIKNDMGESIK